ncbi:MAG TPA: protein kinase [Anaerolineae bacterium]|nr:protein kinase [Anaerolineae bacterium]
MTSSLTFIGRYQIIEPINNGDTATIYQARDPKFDRDVAIKLLDTAVITNHAEREHFERQARLIAKLEHPAIVPIYDFGQYQQRPYMVMRLMEGHNLDHRLQQKPLSIPNITTIINHLAAALDTAHKQNIIHGELKPSNILLDEESYPYLTDFSLLKTINPHQIVTTVNLTKKHLTQNAAYASPEQIEALPVDNRTDVYALGIILFQALTGHLPYYDKNPTIMLTKHLSDPIPNLHQYRSDIPLGYQFIINKALAKQPEARFSTATHFADALEQLLTGEEAPPTAALPITPPPPPSPPPTTPKQHVDTLVLPPPELQAPSPPPTPANKYEFLISFVATLTLIPLLGLLLWALIGQRLPPPPTTIAELTATPATPSNFTNNLTNSRTQDATGNKATNTPAPPTPIPPFPPKTVDAPFLTSPLTIDADDSDWPLMPAALTNIPTQTDETQPPNAASASWRLAWDNTHLYIFVIVNDTLHQPASTTDDLAAGDSLELYFDLNRGDNFESGVNADDFRLVISAADFNTSTTRLFQGRNGNFTIPISPTITLNTQPTDTGYQLEAQIEWANFDHTPLNNQPLGLTLLLNDHNAPTTPPQTKSNITTGFNRRFPQTWGTLTLR